MITDVKTQGMINRLGGKETLIRMKSKIRDIFTKNLLLKFAGLILGVVLWLVLTNSQDPTVTRSLTVPITYDESWLDDNGYIATYKPASVALQVQLRRSYLSRLNAQDFTAVANMQEYLGGAINEAPKYTKINLVVTRSSTATYIDSWEFARNQGSYVEVIIDTVKTGIYEVDFALTGDMPEGYTTGDLVSDPMRVRVTGPTSAFSSLASVKASVDLSKIDMSDPTAAIESVLHLYDGNDRLITNSDLVISQETVAVTVGLYQMKEIGISVASYMGEPAPGYGCSDFDYTPKIVEVMGSKTALAGISTVSIPRSLLNISGADKSMSFQVNLNEYLPSSVSLSEGVSPYVNIVFEIEALEERTFAFDARLFPLVGKDDAYDYEIISGEVDVTFSSFATELDSFSPDSAGLSFFIDVTGLKPDAASCFVPVHITADPRYHLVEDVLVELMITKKH